MLNENNNVGRYKQQNYAKSEMNSIQYSEHTPSKNKINRSKLPEGAFNLDNEGVSQLTYPNEVGQFFHPEITGTGFMPKYSPGPTETHYDPNAYNVVPSTTTSQQNYNIPYDSVQLSSLNFIFIEQLQCLLSAEVKSIQR